MRPRLAAVPLVLGAAVAVLPPAGTPSAAASGSRVPLPADLVAYAQGDRADVQWSLTATHAAAAWPLTTGRGVTVAVVDTGVDATNPDLAGAIVDPAHLEPATGRIVAGAGTDLQGHGTHVAGIVAARADGHGITGVAPDASIMPIDVFTDPDVGGPGIGAAIRWAVAHGARVVNLSLGEPDLEVAAPDVAPVCAAVADAVAAGVVVVAAAGNDGDGANFREAPGDCPGAISVAAVTGALAPSVWSSFDGGVAVAAPGDDVYSTVPSFVSRLGWATMSGTSMAAPFVSGVAALLLAEHPDWPPTQVADRIESTATDVGPPGVDPRTGHGVVDPAAAVGAAAPPVTPAPHLAVTAVGYPTGIGEDGELVFGATYVSWTPDPALAVSAYRITHFDAGGTTTVTVPGTDVRSVVRATSGGYVVTAITSSGEVPSVPVWFDASDDALPPADPVARPAALHATRTRTGDVVVRWTNPVTNTHVDRWNVTVDDDVAAENDRPGPVPTSVRIPAGALPPGDLSIVVTLGSTTDGTTAAAAVRLAAAVPLSGTAVPAGPGRYRLQLDVAPSWARRVCRRSRCTGLALVVAAGRNRTTGWTDAAGGAALVLPGPRHARRLVVSVTPVARRARSLVMRRLVVPVG